MKLSIKSVVLFVNDLGRAERFYADGLGLRVHERTQGAVTLLCGDAFVVLHTPWKSGWEESVRSAYITFQVEDVRQYFSLLVGKGIAGEKDFGAFEGGAEKIRLTDPDGHSISIEQRGESAK